MHPREALHVKLVIDVCLSPQWKAFLEEAGHEAVHWSEIGAADAPDRTIMDWAREHERVVFTHDLDFSALLAATQAKGPSVLQMRAQDVLPEAMGAMVLLTLEQFAEALEEGALLSVDPSRARVRLLPLGT